MVTLRKSLDIDKSTVELDDLIKEVRDLKEAGRLQLALIANQTSKLAAQQTEIDLLKTDMKAQQHVETGALRCGHSSTYSAGTGSTMAHNGWDYFQKEKHMAATFQATYTSPPVVFMSETYIVLNQAQHALHGIQLLNVTKEGFAMRCGCRNDALLDDFEIQWIAVPV